MSVFKVVRRQISNKPFSDIFPQWKREKIFDVKTYKAIIHTYPCINNKPYVTFLLDTSVYYVLSSRNNDC